MLTQQGFASVVGVYNFTQSLHFKGAAYQVEKFSHKGGASAWLLFKTPPRVTARILSSAQPEIWWETLISHDSALTSPSHMGLCRRARRAAQRRTLGVSYRDISFPRCYGFLCCKRLDDLPADWGVNCICLTLPAFCCNPGGPTWT